MAGVVSYFSGWFGGKVTSDRNPNPATGLTDRDRQLITKTWSLVADKSVVKKNGVELFLQLFRNFPEIKNFFKSLQEMSEPELRKSPRLRAHALTVMTQLTTYVDNLDDVGTLVALIQKIATSHAGRNVKQGEFEKIASMMPSFMRSILGSKFTKEAEAAWVKLMTTHNAVVDQTMKAMKT